MVGGTAAAAAAADIVAAETAVIVAESLRRKFNSFPELLRIFSVQ